MLLGSHLRARNLGAVLFLITIAWSLGALAQASDGAKPDAASCEAREIATAIRGCTTLIGGGELSGEKLAQAHLNRGNAYAKRSYYTEAAADFSRVLELAPNNANAYRERGQAYDELSETAKAEADLAEAIRLAPNNPEFYAVRGWVRKNAGDKEAGKADFEQAIKLADKAIEAQQDLALAYYARGNAYAGVENYSRALADLDEAIDLKPEDETFYADRGAIHELKGEQDKAGADYVKALGLQPEYWRALSLRGNLFRARLDNGSAIADATAGIKLNKRNAQAYLNRGLAYRGEKDYARAVADIGEAIRLLPNYTSAYASRGLAYLGQKDYERALADFKRTLELNPKTINAHNGIGKVYIAQKDFQRAIAEYDALIAADPSSENYTMRGGAYEEMGDSAKALADLSEAIRLKPDNTWAFAVRYRVYDKLHDYQKEIADLKELVRLLPDERTYYTSLSQAYDSAGDRDRAISILDQLIHRWPEQTFSYKVRSNFYSSAGEIDKALADANEIIRLKPDDPEGYSYRAQYHFTKSDFDAAIADLTQSIRLNPDGAASNYWERAGARNAKGDYVRAIEDATHAIELAPNIEHEQVRRSVLRTSYKIRAIARANVGDSESALADYNKAIELNPDHAGPYAARGQFYGWQKQYDLAIQDFDKALQLDPSEWISRSNKALALVRLGRLEEASQEVNTGLRSGANRDFYVNIRGLIAYEQGKYAQAVDDLSEAIQLSTFKTPLDYMRRGQAYEKLGQKALAMADYTAAVGLNVPNPGQRDARIIARERLGVLQGETIAAQQPAQPQKAQPADLGRRIALVIGVGAYRNAPGLRNPPNDAAAVAKALRELGFADVTELLDPSRADLEAALMVFGDKAAEADWSVIFYAGHGMQVDGRNFLIPTEAKLASDRHVDFETVVLDKVIESMNGTKKLGLVILDACRDNPFLKRMKQTRSARSFGQGLAAVEPSQGQMIVYATKDGSVAEDGDEDHSPFTKALLTHIHEARLDIRLMFSKVRDSVLQSTQNRQQPFTYGSLPGEGLFFKVAEK
jgi:tetratricopeptide (TPR) repeat protein